MRAPVPRCLAQRSQPRCELRKGAGAELLLYHKAPFPTRCSWLLSR